MATSSKPAAAPLLTVALGHNPDLVVARQRARQVAALVGLDAREQSRIATAVSEVARNALMYAHGGTMRVELDQAAAAPALVFRIQDRGPGIEALDDVLAGRYRSSTGMGMGLAGARRLVDDCRIETGPSGTSVTLLKRLSRSAPSPQSLAEALARAAPRDAYAELAQQNRELARSLAELQQRHDELRHVGQQLEEANRRLGEANLQLGEANQQLGEANRRLAETNHRLEGANGRLEEANRALEDANRRLENANRELASTNQELADTNRGVVALYAELDEQAERLKRADVAKSRFLSSASHELRTPIHSIRSLARMLDERLDGPLAEEQARQVGFIRAAADGLGELVDDLLDLAKIEAGKIELRTVPFDVDTMWSTLRGMMRPLQRARGVALVFEPPPPLRLVADEAKIAQILRNLVSNALKFTEHGEVRVAAAVDAATETIEFSVADTGIGIAPEHLERIFDEFAQIDSPLQRRQRGTGLGLALCRRLAVLLGGTIEVRSRPGAGSTFALRLPLHGRGGVPSALPSSRDAVAGEPARGCIGVPAIASPRSVLLVDDDPAVRYALRRLLTPRLAVHEAQDGLEGLRALQAHAPDAVVLDLQMPGLSGWALLAHVKAVGARPIVLTGLPLDAAPVAALVARGVEVLAKGEDAAQRVARLLEDAKEEPPT